jgi:molybdenum-dependent DNA-binding transcriptional regulator ModE
MLGDLVTMNRIELERLALMQRIEERGTSQRMVAEQLGLSLRHVERLYRSYKASGAAGLVSGKRGRRSNRLVPEQLREAALKLIRSRYAGLRPDARARERASAAWRCVARFSASRLIQCKRSISLGFMVMVAAFEAPPVPDGHL